MIEVGNLDETESNLILEMGRKILCLPSGRWFWCGGTKWMKKPENFGGAYNCISITPEGIEDICFLMESLMRGSGCGYVLEPHTVNKFAPIANRINLDIVGEFGTATEKLENTAVYNHENSIPGHVVINVGDSRQGWAQSLKAIWELATTPHESGEIHLTINVAYIRSQNSPIKGFGGRANPADLKPFYQDVVRRFNKMVGQKLLTADLGWLCCRIGALVVAGNIRRSAEMFQTGWDDPATQIKENMWTEVAPDDWRIDPEKDAFKMANITRIAHHKPTLEDCLESVRKQHRTGEGAIMWAGESVARALGLNDFPEAKREFLHIYDTEGREEAREWAYQFFNADQAEAA